MTDPNYPAKPGRDILKEKAEAHGFEPLACDFADANTNMSKFLEASTVISLKRIADALTVIAARGDVGRVADGLRGLED